MDCGGGMEDQPNNNVLCDMIMHESPPSSTSNMQENPPNLDSAKMLCDGKGSLERISPPSYSEATTSTPKVNVCAI